MYLFSAFYIFYIYVQCDLFLHIHTHTSLLNIIRQDERAWNLHYNVNGIFTSRLFSLINFPAIDRVHIRSFQVRKISENVKEKN